MSSIRIVQYPHPTLRYHSKPIRRVDAELRAIAAQMLDRMYEAEGVGLAANQVDLPLRLFVVNPAGRRGEGEELVILNPELQSPKGSESDREGCLSLPGLYGEVRRAKQIYLSAYDLQGNPIERQLDGFLARIVQHEFDHLNGKFFFDRMTEEQRRELEPGLDDLEIEYRSRQASGAIASDDQVVQNLATWESRYA
ncbi:MAG: peptide deformylase [Planctomycetaceae bacterium]